MYLRPTNETTGPIWPLTLLVQALVAEVVVAALLLYTITATAKVTTTDVVAA